MEIQVYYGCELVINNSFLNISGYARLTGKL